jgi:hypothetical protein
MPWNYTGEMTETRRVRHVRHPAQWRSLSLAGQAAAPHNSFRRDINPASEEKNYMKRITILLLGFVLTSAAETRPAPRHRAGNVLHDGAPSQTDCKSFVGILQATLPTSTPVAQTDVWGGPLFALLGGEYLGAKTVMSGNDGEQAWYDSNMIGVGKGGSYTVCTDYPTCSHTFTFEVPVAIFPNPPDSPATYTGYSIKIVKGTGRFANATGALKVHGPAVGWPDDNPIGLAGRWNAEVLGTVCGVQ